MCVGRVNDSFYCRPEMKRLLMRGVSLVVDRYAFSGVAFTAAKQVRSSTHIAIHKAVIFHSLTDSRWSPCLGVKDQILAYQHLT